MPWSPDNQLTGKIMENIVSVMLQESGYMVLPYGYEQTHPALCQKWDEGMMSTKTLVRLRSSPDFLVYNKREHTTSLVEVKSHIQESNNHLIYKKDFENYDSFWGDCILVQIIPNGQVFYAVWVEELVSKTKNLEGECVHIRNFFTPFDKVFAIKSPVFEKYKKKTLLIMDALRKG